MAMKSLSVGIDEIYAAHKCAILNFVAHICAEMFKYENRMEKIGRIYISHQEFYLMINILRVDEKSPAIIV